MEAQAAGLVLRVFGDLPDPRAGNARHRLMDMLTIAILAVIGGADDVEAICAYGEDERQWLAGFLKLPHGIPSPSTFRRLFARLDPDALEQCFARWFAELIKTCRGKQIAIDGKTLRRSFEQAWAKLGLHMVSAWCVEEQLVLGQVATEQKSNEISAVPQLLDLLDLQGAIVSVDALNCQKDIAQRIISAGGQYLMAVKDNHPILHQQIQNLMQEALLENSPLLQGTGRELEREHGRSDERWVFCSSELVQWVGQRDQWPALASVVMVKSRRRTLTDDKTEWRYFISSLGGNNPQLFADLIRGHWGVENGLHWGLDVSFQEDQSRIGKDHGAETMSVLRRIALNLLKQQRTCRLGIKNKRLKAARSRDYLLRVLTQHPVTK